MTTSMNGALGLVGLGLCVACSGGTGGDAAAPAKPAAASTTSATDKAPYVVQEPAPPEPGTEPAKVGPRVRHAYSHARAEVRSDSVHVVVTDVLVNGSDGETKVTYRFPLPDDATISGFADYQDGRRIDAAIGGKEAAKKAFDKAEAEGKHAGLAETDGPQGFRMDLTPLSAHESRRVELSYVQSMRPLGAERSFVYPSGHAIGEAPRVFELDFSLEAGRALTAIDCPNQLDAHIVKTGDKAARVSLDRAGKLLGTDLVVRWSEASPALDLGVRAARTGEKEPAYVEARFSFTRDPSPDATPPRNVVFVVDTSLSMAGDALDREKQLVSESLRLLNARDKIALVTFDAEVRSWSTPVVADDASKKRLSDEVSLLRAGGASNLDAAIDRAHELLAELPHPTLVMATDGQPTVGEDLDRITPASPPEAFSGADVRVALFNYPSRQKPLEAVFPRLKTEFVPSGPAGADRVRRLAELALAPRIENVHFDVEGLSPESLSGELPAVMALGDSAHFAFRAPGIAKVRVTGTLHGKPIAEERTIVAPEVVDSSDPLPTEWARLRIAALELTYRASHDSAVRAEIVSLGTSFHLVSSLTSLVAAEDGLSPDRVMPGDPEIRVHAPRGASAVRAVLPWGETVDCDWQMDEGLWFGRFLVPRSVADGSYRVPVFVEIQGRTERRTTLLFRVDSKAPEFLLAVQKNGVELRLVATPKQDVFDRDGNGIRKDRVDLKSLVARIGDRSIVLARIDDDHWGATLPAELRGAIEAELVATDYALNISRARHALKVLR